MKKTVFAFLALSCTALAARPEGATPSGGFFIDVFPVINYSSTETTEDCADMTLSDAALSAFYDRPALLAAGVYLEAGGVSTVVSYEFQQDIWSRVWKNSLTNLPDSDATWYPTIAGLGTHYPDLGYAEYEGDYWRFSAGRRKVHAGPGTYGLGISSANPYYDHAAAGMSVPMAGGTLYYDYLAVGMQRWQSELTPKYFFMHRAAWAGRRLALGITDFNLLADVDPDFQDLSPFVFYHHLFNSHHNVMLGGDFEYRPFDELSVYGEFVVDDVQFEGAGSNPTAIGIATGAEWRILRGEANRRPAFTESEHVYSIGREARRGGLVARLEGYLASTYLYKRIDTASANETFAARYQIMSNWPGKWSTMATPYFSAPVGPDTFRILASLDWELGELEADFAAEYRLIGSKAGEKTYGSADMAEGVSWLWPSSPAKAEIALSLGGTYSLDEASVARGSASILASGSAEFAVSIGYGRRLGVGSSPRR